jgi:hypothetical protein
MNFSSTPAGAGIPPGVRKIRCRDCGLPVLLAQAHPGSIAARRYRSPVMLIEPRPRPGRGTVTFSSDGLAVFAPQFPGDWLAHNCPARVSTCKYCRRPVRILHQPPYAAEQLAVLDPDPDPDGTVVINADGHAVHDPGRALPGERYRWHGKHRSGGGEDVASIMTQIPRGAR